jgi:RHH-type rel operon transcriptional repressor/antitoxin RelB
MATRQMNTSVDEEIIDRLDALARRTGRTKSFYAAEFIIRGLEDLEDHFLIKDALDEFHQSDDEAVPHDQVAWDDLDRYL